MRKPKLTELEMNSETLTDTKEIQNNIRKYFTNLNLLVGKSKRNRQCSRFVQTTEVKPRRDLQLSNK